ncbi:hypothetical protein ABPG72_003685 [Tetrahymena utriculariae]
MSFTENTGNQCDLYVFDFDYTIIEENSDTCFYNLFENGKLPKELADIEDENQWTAFMNKVLTYIKQKVGVTSQQLKAELEKCHLIGGMKELFEKIKSKGSDIIIVSDANSNFIKWIVEKNEISHLFTAIYTNPCIIENDQLVIKRFYESHECTYCTGTPNMCKSKIIREHLAKYPGKYENIHYFGDGSNDFCPMFHLKDSNSTGYVRSGFALEKRINNYFNNPDAEPFKCKMVYWRQAYDFLDQI